MTPRSQRGFTLIEVMIALTIMVVMVTALYQAMATSFETKDIVSKMNDRFHEGRQVPPHVVPICLCSLPSSNGGTFAGSPRISRSPPLPERGAALLFPE